MARLSIVHKNPDPEAQSRFDRANAEARSRYDKQKRLATVLGWDLSQAFMHAADNDLRPLQDDITEVVAMWEGANDEDDWCWIVRLNDGKHVFLRGGCDYTGWDCQAYLAQVGKPHLDPHKVFGHAMRTTDDRGWGGSLNDREDIRNTLLEQLTDGKRSETWREKRLREGELVLDEDDARGVF